MRLVMIGLIGAGVLLGQSAPMAVYENPEADRRERLRKSELPSRLAALVRAPQHRLGALTDQERQLLRAPSVRKRTGVHRPMALDLKTAGRWESTGLWRLQISSDEARSLRLHLTDFHAGAGRLWIHDGAGDAAQVFGPWTGDGPWGDGDFWTDVVVGDALVLEFEPAGSSADLPFRIAAVAHGAQVLSEKAQLAVGAAASCNLDVSCYPEWSNTAKAVGRYTFESDDSSYFCSGTLLNVPNTAATPYFLTADHCVSTQAQARSVNIFWLYQTPACRGQVPNTRDLPRSNGSTYVTGTARPGGDVTLLRLNSVPSGVTFAGWTAEAPELGTSVTGIHHPSGDYKRISFAALRTANTRDAGSYWGAFWEGGGLTEGGSSGSGLFLNDGRLVGTLSHGPKFDTEAAYCAALPFADNYGRFSAYFPLLRPYLEGGVAPPLPSGGASGGALTSGVAANFRIGPVTAARLYSGADGYRINVPAGATRLEIRLATATANVDLDLFARFNQDVVVTAGNVVSDHSSTGPSGEEVIVITPAATPALRAGIYYIGLGLFTNNVTALGTLTATVTTEAPPPAGGGSGVVLTSGVARNITLTPVSGPTLLSGNSAYRIDVPAGAQRLDIRLTTPGREDVDLDLFARFGQPAAVSDGNIQADHRSVGPAGDETLAITPATAPPLRAGTYYIHLAVFTTGATINATLTATVTLRDTPPTPPSGIVLTSGQARAYALAAVASPRLFTGGFRIEVPAGATRLDVRLTTPNPAVDVDLYVRGLSEPALLDGRVTADGSSTGPDGNELVSISGAALRPGTYYIALALFTANVDVNGSITATVSTEARSSVTLTSGVPARFRIGPVTASTLYTGTNGFQVTVPAGATRLELRLVTETPDTDVDLYARSERDVTVEDGRVNAEFLSEGLTGSELIVITPNSSPALKAGRYFIALGLFTNDKDATGTVTATVTLPGTPPASSGGSLLTPGVAAKFTFGPVTSPTLFNGGNSFRIVVPEDASRLEVRLASETPSVDTDLYLRRDADVDLADGQAVADFESSSTLGNEAIVVSGADLRPGTYYVSVGLFTRHAVARGSIVANLTLGGLGAPKKVPVDALVPKRTLKKLVEEQPQ